MKSKEKVYLKELFPEGGYDYAPKGGMCVACKFKNNDCSKLDFKNMYVINEIGWIKFVKCSEFERDNEE